MNYEPFTSIENLTLAHFRHFSSLFTNLPAYKALYLRAYKAPDIYVPIRHPAGPFESRIKNPFIYVPIRPCIYVPIRHYICREHSTNQLLFMQNKPNSPNVQIYINIYDTKDYKNFIPLARQKNKPNSNPIKPNSQKAQMNINSLITKDYRKKDDFAVRKNKPNSNPISEKPKMSANAFLQKDYDNETAFRPKKQTQTKPMD